jgi:hypothetical protein
MTSINKRSLLESKTIKVFPKNFEKIRLSYKPSDRKVRKWMSFWKILLKSKKKSRGRWSIVR